MTTTNYLKTISYLLFAAGFIVLTSVSCSRKPASDKQLPNIIFISADDLDWGQVSCNSAKSPVQTNNIDRLADMGIRFSDGYAPAPMCYPSRRCWHNGRFDINMKVGDYWGEGFEQDDKIISQYLKEAGYATGAFGKWHCGVTEAYYPPFSWGFDEFYGVWGLHDNFETVVGKPGEMTLPEWRDQFLTYFKKKSNGIPTDIDGGWLHRYGPVFDNEKLVTELDYLPFDLTDKAIDFIGRNKNQPFFVYLSHNAIHTPLQAPEEYLEQYDGNKMNAMLKALDDAIGRLLDALKEQQLLENTLIVFIGDNGGYTDEDIRPFRGGKGDILEGGIRVPFIMAWPGHFPQQAVVADPVCGTDFLPTFLAAAGIPVPGDRHIDGMNLLPYLEEEKPIPQRPLIFGNAHPNHHTFAVRKGKWKLMNEQPAGGNKGKDLQLQLVNLEQDPGETRNLIHAHPDIAEELHQIWKAELENYESIRKKYN